MCATRLGWWIALEQSLRFIFLPEKELLTLVQKMSPMSSVLANCCSPSYSRLRWEDCKLEAGLANQAGSENSPEPVNSDGC